jgi:hypothetical protein
MLFSTHHACQNLRAPHKYLVGCVIGFPPVTLHSNPGMTDVVFNRFPAFDYKTFALKARNFAVKSRTKFRLKFVRTLNAKSDLIPFLCNRIIPVVSAVTTANSGVLVQ